MSRRPDPERKPQLLEQILDYLIDKPLSALTFRTLADHLGVSTFTLSYHFGTRAELIAEIVRTITTRVVTVENSLEDTTDDLAAWLAALEFSWEWTLDPRNRQLKRLEFEAAMAETLAPDDPSVIRDLMAAWHRIGVTALVKIGMPPAEADLEARLVRDLFDGLQYDLVVTGDVERTTQAFTVLIGRHRQRLETYRTASPRG
jgi:AcrR family transcriptional regulator